MVLKRNGFTLSEDSKDLASKSSSRELPTPKRRKRLEPCVVLGCACVERTSDRHRGGRVEAFSTESGLAGRTAEGHHHSRLKNFKNSVGCPQQVPTDDMATAHPPPHHSWSKPFPTPRPPHHRCPPSVSLSNVLRPAPVTLPSVVNSSASTRTVLFLWYRETNSAKRGNFGASRNVP